MDQVRFFFLKKIIPGLKEQKKKECFVHLYLHFFYLACVQMSPLPQKKSGDLFSEGGGTSVHILLEKWSH